MAAPYRHRQKQKYKIELQKQSFTEVRVRQEDSRAVDGVPRSGLLSHSPIIIGFRTTEEP